MNRLILSAVFLAALTFFPLATYAWDKPGHMLVAAIAYMDLKKNDTATLDKIIAILQTHPAISTWKSEYAQFHFLQDNGVTLEAYIFMRAAAWPDDVKTAGNPDDHKKWHYIDYPITLPDKITFNELDKKENALIAFGMVMETLNGSTKFKALKLNKPKSLSWIFHLVGDVHQPLHGASLMGPDFPKGDSGGNDVCIKTPGGKVSNLHSYWDDIVIENASSRALDGLHAWQDANYLPGKFKKAVIGNATGSAGMKAWSKESVQLALDNVYNFGGVKVNFVKKIGDKCPNMQNQDAVSGDYEKNADKLAQERIVVAGKRLAKLLSAGMN